MSIYTFYQENRRPHAAASGMAGTRGGSILRALYTAVFAFGLVLTGGTAHAANTSSQIVPGPSSARAQCTSNPDVCAPGGFVDLTFLTDISPDECTYNITADWGDGTVDQFPDVRDGDSFTHQYAQPGVYTARFTFDGSIDNSNDNTTCDFDPSTLTIEYPADGNAGGGDGLLCQGQVVTLFGTSGNDTLTGTSGPDVIKALGGNDTIKANAGDDVICGDAGDDTVLGDSGNDRVEGGIGNDRVEGGAGNDKLQANDGNDRENGGVGDDELNGDGGNDELNGAPGSDRLDGGTGVDRCDGGIDADKDTGRCEISIRFP